MSDTKLDRYRAAQGTVPQMMLRWHLYGAGLENMGKEGQPEEVAVPSYGPDELLVRQAFYRQDAHVIHAGGDADDAQSVVPAVGRLIGVFNLRSV